MEEKGSYIFWRRKREREVDKVATGMAPLSPLNHQGVTYPLREKESTKTALETGISSPEEKTHIQRNEDGDTLEISREARRLLEKTEEEAEEETEIEGSKEKLSVEEKQEVRQLAQRDSEVRAHENAHVVASGRIMASSPVYTFEQGPDGKLYAVAGEVRFRTPPAKSPREKLEIAQQLRHMALAPASPSSKDRMVAAKAAQQETQARLELQMEKDQDSLLKASEDQAVAESLEA